MQRVFVVGAGRVGAGLAVALERIGRNILGTWSRTAEGSRRAETVTGSPSYTGELPAELRDAELVIVAVPDDAVAPTVEDLAEAGRLGPGQLVIHVSGSLDLSALAAAGRVGARVGSLHPLQAFSDAAHAAEAFTGALGMVDGDPAVRAELRDLAAELGMRPAELPPGPDSRVRYHAAAVSVAGHLVGLFDLALEIAEAAGLDRDVARAGLVTLARGTLDNLERHTPAEALTGPVARGDAEVVRRHLTALEELPEDSLALYRALLERSLQVARRRGAREGLDRVGEVLAEARRAAPP